MGREQQGRWIREICLITHEEDSVGRIHRNEKMYYVFMNVQFDLHNSARGSFNAPSCLFRSSASNRSVYQEIFSRPR
jgi:hypothetical protein